MHIRVNVVQVRDARDDDSSNAAGNKKLFLRSCWAFIGLPLNDSLGKMVKEATFELLNRWIPGVVETLFAKSKSFVSYAANHYSLILVLSGIFN